MKNTKLLSFLFIFLISAISVIDLFINVGRPATFDAPTHITDIAGYSEALTSGDFPVFWLDKFGNYGMPVGFFSHQLPLTLAGGINILVHNPVIMFYIFFFLAIFFANLGYFYFLRLYFSTIPSLVGLLLLTVAPYRITNIYIRGDMPETFSGIFLPLILIGTYFMVKKQKFWGFFLIAISFFGISITHPMMLLTYSFFILPYLIFLILEKSGIKKILTLESIKLLITFLVSMILGIGMGLYFLLPLVYETKYLYFGQETNHLSPQFLSWKNLIGENWFYFYNTDIFTRGQFMQLGIFEEILILSGIVYLLYCVWRKRWKALITLPSFVILSSLAAVFMISILSSPLYQHIHVLTDIQFPWRFLALFIFLPAILLAAFLERFKKIILVLIVVILIALVRFPQLYGKNYTTYPMASYYFTPYNLFPIFMNTIWTGKTEDYPIENQKVGIITGTGEILSQHVANSSRIYTVSAQTSLRMVDYTFYFPGWHVYIDGALAPIQFQDPSFRGVITYNVPQGHHVVAVVLQDTVIQKVGKILSIFCMVIFGGLFIFRKKLDRIIL